MSISILIASYGEEEWKQLALTRALPSAQSQGVEVLVEHQYEGTNASSRNALAQKATGEWLLYLDADDQLAAGYIDAMKKALEQSNHDDNTLFTPAVSYIVRGRAKRPHFQKEVDLREGNWLTIGTLLSKKLFLDIGGFREYDLYEDWDLWTRCHKSGARIVKVPRAIYLAFYSRSSRNRNVNRYQRNFWHQRIGRDNWPDLYEDTTPDEESSKSLGGVRKYA